jgi:hypothetical protein
MSPIKRCSLWVCLAGCALCLAGCYERSVEGAASVYSFADWVRVLAIVVGLAGVPAGWLLRRWGDRLGFVLMGLSPILLIIVVPGLFMDRVVVDAEHFEARYGFWFAPSDHRVRFDDLQLMRYVRVEDSRGRGSYQLECQTRQGDVVTVHAGDLVSKAVPEILDRARARGVPVAGPAP